jgi:hypothetical protein
MRSRSEKSVSHSCGSSCHSSQDSNGNLHQQIASGLCNVVPFFMAGEQLTIDINRSADLSVHLKFYAADDDSPVVRCCDTEVVMKGDNNHMSSRSV